MVEIGRTSNGPLDECPNTINELKSVDMTYTYMLSLAAMS